MAPYGGFEHNRQSLRIVERLEERYPGFNGLNLSWETREGIIKHSSDYDRPDQDELAEYQFARRPTLEAQIIDLADEIAYNNHDIDDGLKAAISTRRNCLISICGPRPPGWSPTSIPACAASD